MYNMFDLVTQKMPPITSKMLFPGALKDKTLRQIARKAGNKRVDLGLELELDWADISTLQCEHSDPIDHAFHILLVIDICSFAE